ncbi:MAG TPA: CARDB domain-containing protein [Thermoanaerobaculia bacterium]|nr:CARDB domain-containing protein [Thermoanaerobaculia bacterium]
MPALRVKLLAVAPEHPQPEETTEVRLTIDNAGAATDVEVAFHAEDDQLATHTVTIPAHGEVTVAVPWMAKTAGTYTLAAIVDPGRELDERDRYDNVAMLDVVVSEPPAVEADFALTAMEAFMPPDAPGGLRIEVANVGDVAASAPVIVRRDGRRVAVLPAGPIDAGKSVTVEMPWSDPDRGKWSAEVNPRYAAAEPDAKNNTIVAGPPTSGADLRIESLAFHTQSDGRERRNIGINFRIVNDGGQDIDKPFRTRIDPGAVDPDGNLVPAYVTTDALPAGGVVYVSHIFESAPDDFAVTASADVDGAADEDDEDNNELLDEFHHAALEPDRWVSIGPRNIINSNNHGYGWTEATGRLSTMAIHPTQTSTLYVGAQLSGVWRTMDGGTTWSALAEGAPMRIAAHPTWSMIKGGDGATVDIDPTNSSNHVRDAPVRGQRLALHERGRQLQPHHQRTDRRVDLPEPPFPGPPEPAGDAGRFLQVPLALAERRRQLDRVLRATHRRRDAPNDDRRAGQHLLRRQQRRMDLGRRQWQ